MVDANKDNQDHDPNDDYGPPIGPMGYHFALPSQEEQDAFWEWYGQTMAEAYSAEDSSNSYHEAVVNFSRKYKTQLCEAYCRNKHVLERRDVKLAGIIADAIAHRMGALIPPFSTFEYIVKNQILDRICTSD